MTLLRRPNERLERPGVNPSADVPTYHAGRSAAWRYTDKAEDKR